MAGRVRRRRALVALAAVLLALGLGEFGLRWAVHGQGRFVRRFAWRLRQAQNFADPRSGRDFFKLKALLAGGGAERRHPYYHPRLGWTDPRIGPDFRHEAAARVAARRPVLLFGDSYAHCVTQPGECWEGLLERSGPGHQYALLNYGVGGYGLDQVFLLLQATLDLYRADDPIVVIGILVDDDLDRTYLGLRESPKPRFESTAAGLVLRPPLAETPRAFLERDPPQVRSYLWRWLLNGVGLFGQRARLAWSPEADHVQVKQALCQELLARIAQECRAREMPFFFVLFHGRRALRSPAGYSWQEPFLLRELERLGLPYVSSRTRLLPGAAASAEQIDRLFYLEGPEANHYRAQANERVFAALLDGLQGRYDGP